MVVSHLLHVDDMSFVGVLPGGCRDLLRCYTATLWCAGESSYVDAFRPGRDSSVIYHRFYYGPNAGPGTVAFREQSPELITDKSVNCDGRIRNGLVAIPDDSGMVVNNRIVCAAWGAEWRLIGLLGAPSRGRRLAACAHGLAWG